MSVRGQPEGDTAEARIEAWLARESGAGENMIWVGKNYSLAQLKQDVSEVVGELSEFRDYIRYGDDDI